MNSELSPTYDMMQPLRGPREREQRASQNFSWIDSAEPHKQLAPIVHKLVMSQNLRLAENTRFASLYANEDFLRPVARASGKIPAMPRQTLNLIKVYTDTLAGKLVQSNSRVQAVTIQGDWKTFRLARKLDRLLDATFLQGRLSREASQVAIDGLRTGNGYLYVGAEDGKICYERWYYNELFVDHLDAMYGRPTMLFRLRYMYPDAALAKWGKTPEQRDAILKAPRAQPPQFQWAPFEDGMIEIFEAWAIDMPGRPGKHVVCTVKGTLVDEKYRSNKFPVVNFKVGDLPLGWYGQGFIAHSGGTQIWLNRILDIMAESAKLGIAPWFMVAGNADIAVKQLNNVPGHVVTSNGPAPQWQVNKPFHEIAPQYVELLTAQLGIMYGISDIESSGQMAGNRVDSNPALVQLQDMWMARHTILLANWSKEFFMDVAERTLEVAQEIARKKGSYPIVASARGRAWAMDWKDFTELKRESYRLQLADENALPLTPAARKQMIMEWASAGLLSQEQAQQMMLGGADLEAAVSQFAAFENNAAWVCEQLMDGETPELSGLQKPDILLQRVRAAGLMAQEYGAPDKVVLGFEKFAARVSGKIQTTQAAMMPPGGMNAPGNPTPAPAPGLPVAA